MEAHDLTSVAYLGGLSISSFVVLTEQNQSFVKLLSAPLTADDWTIVTVYNDQFGSPLTSDTSYTLKAIALTFGNACVDLLDGDFESDVIVVVTDVASAPNPPQLSITVVAGSSALITLLPPDDWNGAVLYGYTVQLLSVSANPKTLYADINSRSMKIPNLMALTNYSIMASVRSDMGESAYSEEQWFETGEPTAPSELKAFNFSDLGPDSVLLYWSEPSNSGGGKISGRSNAYFVTDFLFISCIRLPNRLFCIPKIDRKL